MIFLEAKAKISVVIPVFRESENAEPLVEALSAVISQSEREYEVLIVDDGSTDDTVEKFRRLQKSHGFLRIIKFRRNFGQTAAMAAGFDHARGDIIVPMDGDLQNDPADIPKLVAKLEEGYDVVSGWRKNRKDTLLTRKLPSWIANYVIGVMTSVKLHDYGCTLKAYRREVIENLNLYGEMHRFIPAIAFWSGARVTEMEVNHRHRLRGQTKYGLSRTLKVILDLMTVKFLGKFSTKPIHFFGGFGMLSFFGACVSGAIVLYQKFIHISHLSMNKNPLLTLTTLFIIMSVQFLLMGLLAEMMCRTYHESQGKPTYIIREIFEPVVKGKDSESSG